jgi:RsiW-degrading membrane proteinase PrsW (M82 family)
MSHMLIYVTLFACAALMVVLVRRYDLTDKEPWYMLLAAVAVGIVLMWVVGQVEDFIFLRLNISDRFATKAALVSLLEESAKIFGVLFIAAAFARRFNDALDGLIYGTLCGLGMAIEESVMYIGLAQEKNAWTLGSEVVRLFAHSLMGGLMGFAVGLTLRPADRKEPRKIALPLTCIAVALIVHFCWDFIAYRAHIAPLMRGVLMLLMLSLMLMWGAMVAYAMDMSRRFAPTRKVVVIPV